MASTMPEVLQVTRSKAQESLGGDVSTSAEGSGSGNETGGSSRLEGSSAESQGSRPTSEQEPQDKAQLALARESRCFPSLARDGPATSMGSGQHPDGCKPCTFYCFSTGGCRHAQECSCCHLFHESRIHQRRDEWKKGRKASHRERQDRRERKNLEASVSSESMGCVAATEAYTMPMPYQSEVAYIQEGLEYPAPYPGSSQEQAVRVASLRSSIACNLIEVLQQSNQLQLSAPVSVSAGHDTPPNINGIASLPPNLAELAMKAGLSSELSALLDNLAPGLGVAPGVAMPPPYAQPELSYDPYGVPPMPGALMSNMANGYRMNPNNAAPCPSGPNGLVNPSMLEISMANALASEQGQCGLVNAGLFSYTPRDVAATVGQAISLFPSVMSPYPRVFAVAPDLPRGLTIDKYNGVISGIPQEATDGNISYFVTSACPVPASVEATSIRINVMSRVDLNPDSQAQEALAAGIQEMLMQTIAGLRKP